MFLHEIDENYAIRGYYPASNGNLLPRLRENLSVPYSWVKIGPTGCPEKSVRNYQHSLRNDLKEGNSQKFVNKKKKNIVKLVILLMKEVYGFCVVS